MIIFLASSYSKFLNYILIRLESLYINPIVYCKIKVQTSVKNLYRVLHYFCAIKKYLPTTLSPSTVLGVEAETGRKERMLAIIEVNCIKILRNEKDY